MEFCQLNLTEGERARAWLTRQPGALGWARKDMQTVARFTFTITTIFDCQSSCYFHLCFKAMAIEFTARQSYLLLKLIF